jgi:hypothetical protein
MQNKGTVPKLTVRKTSAEIVKEAQSSLLSNNGAKLVSTKRPITPNVNNRQLYGNSSMANRPPSAFNLKYLQYETRALPSLEPISQSPTSSAKISPHHIPTIYERQEGSAAKTKLPALLEPPVISLTESIDAGKFWWQ